MNNTPYDPFAITEALIRDLPHVLVTRLAAQDGCPCIFKKEFKPSIDGAEYWKRREIDFLLDFASIHLKHVPQLAEAKLGGQDMQTLAIESLATWDAGITLEDWLKIQPRYSSGITAAHPFQDASMFLQLVRACLVALREIHRSKIVHCDIKPDNICLPYTPYPHQASQPVKIEFDSIHLIDFAFSIDRDRRPLERPLPISPEANYQAKSLKAALQEDQYQKNPAKLATQNLDYRIDLYSLGYLARQIHDHDAGLWPPAGNIGRTALDMAAHIVEKLEAFNNNGKRLSKPPPLPHDGFIQEINSVLNKLTDLQARQRFIVTYAQDPNEFSPVDKAIPPCTPTPMTLMEANVAQPIPSHQAIPIATEKSAQITPLVINGTLPVPTYNRHLLLLFLVFVLLSISGVSAWYHDDMQYFFERIKYRLRAISQAVPPSINTSGAKALRPCTSYGGDASKDYSYCRFQGVAFLSTINPENYNFKGAVNLPAWIEKGLDKDGIYRQYKLIENIRFGFKELQQAYLEKADLSYIDLSQANMLKANLREANLFNAILKNVKFEDADLTWAVYDDNKLCGKDSFGKCRK